MENHVNALKKLHFHVFMRTLFFCALRLKDAVLCVRGPGGRRLSGVAEGIQQCQHRDQRSGTETGGVLRTHRKGKNIFRSLILWIYDPQTQKCTLKLLKCQWDILISQCSYLISSFKYFKLEKCEMLGDNQCTNLLLLLILSNKWTKN